MDRLTKPPETITAWELALPLRCPSFGIVPEGDGIRSIAQIHNAAWIEDVCLRQGQPEMTQQTFMAPPRFEARHLSCANVEGPGTATEGSCAASGLMVRFQQGDGQPLF